MLYFVLDYMFDRLNLVFEDFNEAVEKIVCDFLIADNLDWRKCKKDEYSYKLEKWKQRIDIWHKSYLHLYHVDFLWNNHYLKKEDYIDLEQIREKLDTLCTKVYRTISMKQLSNDLFFEFEWVGKKIKFSWYNDNDWWTKYKPLEIKEDDITREIDYDEMEAKYLWVLPSNQSDEHTT